MPLAATGATGGPDRRESEAVRAAAANKEKGLENPSYSTHMDSRYAHALPTISQSVSPSAPPPGVSVIPPPPNMPPPAYTPSAQPEKKIPPRLPSMNPSAIYSGGSVMLNRGGSTATYGGYEQPDLEPQNGVQDFDNSMYEEIDDIRSNNPPAYAETYTEIGNADSGYMDLQPQ